MADNDKIFLPPEMAAEFQNPAWGAKQLKGISLMRNFSDIELEAIYSAGEILSYKPKSYAVIEGEPSRGLFIILHGTVGVYKNDAMTGNMLRLAFLEQGESFGELSLFDTAPRSATVSAENVCHMFHLEGEKFEKFLDTLGSETKVRFYRTCAEDLVARFRNLNGDYISSQQLLWKYALRNDNVNKPSTKQEQPEAAEKEKVEKPRLRDLKKSERAA